VIAFADYEFEEEIQIDQEGCILTRGGGRRFVSYRFSDDLREAVYPSSRMYRLRTEWNERGATGKGSCGFERILNIA